MNATATNAGGWEQSELRAKMNGGEIWSLMPPDFQSKVKAVKKLTNNVGGGDENQNAAMSSTSDKLFILSFSEIVQASHWASDYPWTSSEGTQYEAFRGKVTNNFANNDCLQFGGLWWERSVNPTEGAAFLVVGGTGSPLYGDKATTLHCVLPAFCF